MIRLAQRIGAGTTADGAHDGHTGAVTAAAKTLARAGGEGFLTVPGDIPLATTDEVRRILNAHRGQEGPAFTIAPSHDERGSNAIACSPVNEVPLQFGDDSFLPHLAAARSRGIAPQVLELAGISEDIDTPQDLDRVITIEGIETTRTFALLREFSGRRPGKHRKFKMTSMSTSKILASALDGRRPDHAEARLLAEEHDLATLVRIAARLRDDSHGDLISYSRKVFIPLTKLCRDVCHYCTFAHPPRKGERAYLSPDEVLEIAEQGRAAGCHEALFTLGDKPELRYRMAADELAAMAHASTLEYLADMARMCTMPAPAFCPISIRAS